MDKKILSTPALYISYFLKKNRIEYYDRMNEVRTKGNYEQWIKFFLEAIYESAKDAAETIDKLAALREKNINKLEKLGRRSKNAVKLYEYLVKALKSQLEELNVTWRKLYKEYRIRKINDPKHLKEAAEKLEVSVQELMDILDVAYAYSHREELQEIPSVRIYWYTDLCGQYRRSPESTVLYDRADLRRSAPYLYNCGCDQ